jgi:hypothetical protein
MLNSHKSQSRKMPNIMQSKVAQVSSPYNFMISNNSHDFI